MAGSNSESLTIVVRLRDMASKGLSSLKNWINASGMAMAAVASFGVYAFTSMLRTFAEFEKEVMQARIFVSLKLFGQ